MITDGGDNSNLGGGGKFDGGRESMGAEAFQPRVERTDNTNRTNDASDSTTMSLEQGLQAATGITEGVASSTTEKFTRLGNDPNLDPAQKADWVNSLRDGIAFHGERSQAQGQGTTASTMLSDAFESGMRKAATV